MSISPEDAQKKLEVVAVFVLVNENGDFYEMSQGDMVVIPLYLQASNAKSQLDQLLKSQKGLKGRIQAFSLNLFYKKAEELRKAVELKGKKLETPIVIPESDMTKAVEILKSEGVPEEKIKSGLRAPIFFAEPMISAKTPSGDRQVFFVGYNQLQQGIEALPADKRGSVKARAADLQVVLDLITATKEDKYAFMATEDYIKLREEFLKSQSKQQGKPKK